MGITIGALVVRKLSPRRREADPAAASPARSPTRLRDLAEAIGDFGADVRAAAADREAELRAGTGLDAPLPAGERRSGCRGRRGAHAAETADPDPRPVPERTARARPRRTE